MSGHASHVATTVLIEGLENAVERLRAADATGAAGFHALFEAIGWAGVISERLRHDGRPVTSRLAGFWYVRNLGLHQGADVALEMTGFGEGAFGEGPFGGAGFRGGEGRGGSLTFPPIAHLPEGRSTKGAEEYERFIAGRDVREVFDDVIREMTGAQTGAQEE